MPQQARQHTMEKLIVSSAGRDHGVQVVLKSVQNVLLGISLKMLARTQHGTMSKTIACHAYRVNLLRKLGKATVRYAGQGNIILMLENHHAQHVLQECFFKMMVNPLKDTIHWTIVSHAPQGCTKTIKAKVHVKYVLMANGVLQSPLHVKVVPQGLIYSMMP